MSDSGLTFCRAGFFIGISEFADANVPDLPATTEDARVLHGYFANALPEASWQLFEAECTRTKVLAEIWSWAQSVESQSVGLLSIGSHGHHTRRGLALAPKDFDLAHPVDSGILLSRVLSILGEQAFDRRYVLLLDCCRTGYSSGASVDYIPPNVSVIYSVNAGRNSVESQRGGRFARALVAALDSCPSTIADANRWIDLAALSPAIHDKLADSRDRSLRPELYVGNGSTVLLPHSHSSQFRDDEPLILEVLLQSRRFTRATYAEKQENVAVLLSKDWHSAGGKVDVIRGVQEFLVRLYEFRSRVDALQFIQQFLGKMRYTFHQLQIKLGNEIPSSARAALIREIGAEMISGDERSLLSYWKDSGSSDIKGILEISEKVIIIRCNDANGTERGIDGVRNTIRRIVLNLPIQ